MDPLISIVIPVYNESGNIQTTLRGISAALQNYPHEILLVYDFDADTTLPAIEAMPDRSASIRLVKNELGKGVVNALKTGFESANGDVVVTTMADLSDDPADIPEMVRKCREGAAVVAGSRYVRGGKQIGGQVLKRLLSRMAGLSLHWIAGVKTHDATNNFRAYRTDFLRSVRVESQQGFEVALELTVKAHLKELSISEVPTLWRDRTNGESRFRLQQWLPSYLYWYFTAIAVPLCVWLIAVGLYVCDAQWIHYRHFPIPHRDSAIYLDYITGEKPITMEWLWSPHNEHRIFFPKLFYLLISIPSHGNQVLLCVGNTLWLFAAAWVCLLGTRQIRGRNVWSDLFFPFLILTPTLCDENWQDGFMGCNTIPSSLLIITGVLLMTWKNNPGFGRIVTLILCLIILPLCGIGHVATGSCLALLSLIPCFQLLKSDAPYSKMKSGLLSLGAVIVGFLSIFHFVGYGKLNGECSIITILWCSLHLYCGGLLGMNFRHAFFCYVAMVLMVVILVTGLGLLWKKFYRDNTKRMETLLSAGVLLTAGILIGSIGYGRGFIGTHGITAGRLISFAIPAQVFLYLIFTKYGKPNLRSAAHTVIILILTFGILTHGIVLPQFIKPPRKDWWGLHQTLHSSRLAEMAYNKQYQYFPFKEYGTNSMELVVKHRLGILQKIKPLYFFDKLVLLKHLEPPTNFDILILNAEKNSVQWTDDGCRFRCSVDSVECIIKDVPVTAHHAVATRVTLENTDTKRTYQIYYVNEPIIRQRPDSKKLALLDNNRSIEITLELLKPILDTKVYLTSENNFEGEESKDWATTYMIPIPGEYVIRSVECRALPVQ